MCIATAHLAKNEYSTINYPEVVNSGECNASHHAGLSVYSLLLVLL